MKRLINQHPGRFGKILLGLIPFILIIALYVFASNERLAINPNDKLMPSFSTIASTAPSKLD